MSEGDWLKLGRARLRVQKISSQSEKLTQSQLPDFFNSFDSEEVDIKNELNTVNEATAPCRICLSETGSNADPLISTCKCAGTMKYVHLNCLKE